jgi:RNA polymerase sigma factor (sigma-70 family)
MSSQNIETARWFAEYVQPHEPSLRGYLHGMVGPADIDDIVQETYRHLLRARERGSIECPRGLLFAAARNVVRDLIRRRAVAKTFSVAEVDISRVLDSAPGVHEMVIRNQEVDLLAAAIRELPNRCCKILVLRKYENLSHREIAHKLGISEHTVESQLTKALHRCQEFFVRKGALPPP